MIKETIEVHPGLYVIGFAICLFLYGVLMAIIASAANRK